MVERCHVPRKPLNWIVLPETFLLAGQFYAGKSELAAVVHGYFALATKLTQVDSSLTPSETSNSQAPFQRLSSQRLQFRLSRTQVLRQAVVMNGVSRFD